MQSIMPSNEPSAAGCLFEMGAGGAAEPAESGGLLGDDDLGALLRAREDELRAVRATSAALTSDMRCRAQRFFDDVVVRVKAGVEENAALEQRRAALEEERDLVTVARDGLRHHVHDLEESCADRCRERDDARRKCGGLEKELTRTKGELKECQRRLALSREAEATAQQRICVYVAECDAALVGGRRPSPRDATFQKRDAL